MGSADLTQHLLYNNTNGPRILQPRPRSLSGNPGCSHGEGHEVSSEMIAERVAATKGSGKGTVGKGTVGKGADAGRGEALDDPAEPAKRRKNLIYIYIYIKTSYS